MITTKNLSDRLIEAEYAVRGPIVIRAQELEAEGKKITYCNIGNPQALKQRPLTYVRQVLSLVEYPALMDNPAAIKDIPKDIVERAKSILARHSFGTGAYTQSAGIPFIRKAVAEFIAKRDGIPAEATHVILTDGASKGVQAVLSALIKDDNAGLMIPIPQYPLYSATLTLLGGKAIGYHLDEDNQWQLNEEVLEKSLAEAKAAGVDPLGIVIINPGNPTGAVLSHDNVKMIVGFARRHDLVVIADEVYQENVYTAGCEFHSFAKIMHELGEADVTLFSMHSVSKGFIGECGHRGGYLELRNIPEDVLSQFVKLQSISLCSNVPGQLTTYLMITPPEPADESYDTYIAEKEGILNDLKTKAEILGKGVNKIKGMFSDIPQGAMYAFVRFELPIPDGVSAENMTTEERLAWDKKRDSAYCMALLEETGICVVPGSGFGQLPGTLHFRTTFLPPRDEITDLVVKLKAFHEGYVAKM